MRLTKLRGARGFVPLIALLSFGIGLAGCSGDDGNTGAQGPPGPVGPPGPGTVVDPIASAKPETCTVCHGSAGSDHQSIYNDYRDAETKSQYVLNFEDVTGDGVIVNSVETGVGTGRFTVTAEFRVTKNGLPYNDVGLSLLPQKRFAIQQYFASDPTYPFQGQFYDPDPTKPLPPNAQPGSVSRPYTTSLGTIKFLGDGGRYTVAAQIVPNSDPTKPPTNNTARWDPLAASVEGYQVYGYIAANLLATEGQLGRFPLYGDVSDDGLAVGTAVPGTATAYESKAVVTGCELCHGKPYLKHGYRAAAVTGLTDFAACKECHFDDRDGSHPDWQYMVDKPFDWATGVLTGDELAKAYRYKASVMQDTHQTHAMEFPYPQSMANCATCHKGKDSAGVARNYLPAVLADDNFKPSLCQSCHPVNGTDGWEGQKYFQEASDGGRLRAPAITEMWAEAEVAQLHGGLDLSDDGICLQCHGSAGFAPKFSAYHSGYEAQIYAADGTRYADAAANKVSIDSVTLTGDLLDIKFSAPNTSIVPTVTVSFYGYETKHMLVSSHTADAGELTCFDFRGQPAGCGFELKLNGTATNRLFTIAADSIPGAWHVTANLAAYEQPAATGLASIPELIESGKVARAEIVVLPYLVVGGVNVSIDTQSKTLDLASGAFDDNFFKGTAAIVDVKKCNACHDALGTTFHNASYGGNNVVACRSCHVTSSGGALLEMQSRGFDSYIHSIHKFQKLGAGFLDFSDPVVAARYDQHVEHLFPNFTIKNCEGCHNKGTYEVPDQSKSLPGLESPSWQNDTWDRSIGNVPEYVVGPANRACGGCHRAVLINEDDAGGLLAFNTHTDMGGYTLENGATEDGVDFVYAMIDRIMSFFD